MLIKNSIFLHKRASSSLFFRWLFVYFNYFLVLSIHRVFTPTIDKIKAICLQHRVFSSVFSSKQLSIIFHNNTRGFFSSTGLILCAVSPFSSIFFSSLNPLILSTSNVLAVIANQYFLNISAFSMEHLFSLFSREINTLQVFLIIFSIFSNLFSGLFLFSNMLCILEKIALFNKKI